ARLAPLACRTRLTFATDLIDVPVDLEIVAVRVGELDGDLTASATATLEHDRHAVLTKPGTRAEHLVERPDLEGEVIEAAAPGLLGAAHERHAMVVGVAAENDHA